MVDVVADLGAVMLGSRLKRLAERLQGSAATLLAEADVPLQPGQVAVMVALAILACALVAVSFRLDDWSRERILAKARENGLPLHEGMADADVDRKSVV